METKVFIGKVVGSEVFLSDFSLVGPAGAERQNLWVILTRGWVITQIIHFSFQHYSGANCYIPVSSDQDTILEVQ